jgi:dipeptidase D
MLADIYQKFYKKIFKNNARQALISGGVEPAFILSKRTEMFGISVGPLMRNVHSFEEELNVESTMKLYSLIVKFLPTLKQ